MIAFALFFALILAASYCAYRIGLSVGNERAMNRMLAQIRRERARREVLK